MSTNAGWRSRGKTWVAVRAVAAMIAGSAENPPLTTLAL
jgi:hypothetical protein